MTSAFKKHLDKVLIARKRAANTEASSTLTLKNLENLNRIFNEPGVSFTFRGEKAKEFQKNVKIFTKSPAPGEIADIIKTLGELKNDVTESSEWQILSDSLGEAENTAAVLRAYRFQILSTSRISKSSGVINLYQDLAKVSDSTMQLENLKTEYKNNLQTKANNLDESTSKNGLILAIRDIKSCKETLLLSTVDNVALDKALGLFRKTLYQGISSENFYLKGQKEREHTYAVTVKPTHQNIRVEIRALKGDLLKKAILGDFRDELLNCKDKEELAIKKAELKNTDQYKILAEGQDRPSRIFGLKTSSVKAFDNMYKEIEKELSTLNPPKLG